jgi:hypothetical protein
MERGLIPNTTSRIQLCGELPGGLQGAARPCWGSGQSLRRYLFSLVFRQFLQLFWYFVFPSAFAIWYFHSVSANLFCVLE